jgi:hypothetical protein
MNCQAERSGRFFIRVQRRLNERGVTETKAGNRPGILTIGSTRPAKQSRRFAGAKAAPVSLVWLAKALDLKHKNQEY